MVLVNKKDILRDAQLLVDCYHMDLECWDELAVAVMMDVSAFNTHNPGILNNEMVLYQLVNCMQYDVTLDMWLT